MLTIIYRLCIFTWTCAKSSRVSFVFKKFTQCAILIIQSLQSRLNWRSKTDCRRRLWSESQVDWMDEDDCSHRIYILPYVRRPLGQLLCSICYVILDFREQSSRKQNVFRAKRIRITNNCVGVAE